MKGIFTVGAALVALWFQGCSTAPVRNQDTALSGRDDVQQVIDSITSDRRTWVDPSRLF